MDIHRIKFLDVKPKAIASVSFNESTDPPTLAIARSDSSIEIWRGTGREGRSFCHHVTIPGDEDSGVQTVLWRDDRLFSAGLSGFVHEWDISRLTPCHTADAMGSPVLCMGDDKGGEVLVAGCSDGRICVYDISNHTLLYTKSLDRQDTRALSLSLLSPLLAVGCSDSTIRLLNIETGSCVQRITVDREPGLDTRVWSVNLLNDATIVSGSSLGKIQVWNCRFGTLKQSFQSFLADVTTIVVSKDESDIFASGVDQKIVHLRKVWEGVGGRGVATWVVTQEERVHSHDVKTLSLSGCGLVASGGVDSQLIISEAGQLNKYTRYSPFSSWTTRFSYARSGSILLYQDNTALKLWRVTPKMAAQQNGHRTPSASCSPDKDALIGSGCGSPGSSVATLPSLVMSVESDMLLQSGLPLHFLEIKVSTPKHILSSAINSAGLLVSFSDIDHVWLYSIDSYVAFLGKYSFPSRFLSFHPTSSQLLLCLVAGGLLVATVTASQKGRDVSFRELEPPRDKKSSHVTFSHAQFSPSGQHIAAINSKHRIYIYDTVSFKLLSKISRLDHTYPPALTFNSPETTLSIFTSENRELHHYDITGSALNSMGQLDLSCKTFYNRTPLGMTRGLFPLSSQSETTVAYDLDSLIFMRPVASPTQYDESSNLKKRKQVPSLKSNVVQNYRELLFAAPLSGDNELLVIEKPWTSVMEALPPSLKRDRYGN